MSTFRTVTPESLAVPEPESRTIRTRTENPPADEEAPPTHKMRAVNPVLEEAQVQHSVAAGRKHRGSVTSSGRDWYAESAVGHPTGLVLNPQDTRAVSKLKNKLLK